ncbi:putative glycolipid-binding domain-containing protein [Chitinophaga niabensis]|uniref:putative glycolipid-binding domain-containing protein n=1 Tax=Chitinophaga niabensis TaxID=536979 RepID=UPI0031BA5FE0
MKKQIVWKGLFQQMMEYCNVETTETDIRIDGTIVGYGEDTPFSVNYDIILDRLWQVSSLEMAVEKAGEYSWISLQRDQDGVWTQSGHTRPEWAKCIDIDISLTPLTNTLPINRLQLEPKDRREIDVLYINIFKDEIKPVKQFYTNLGDDIYKYEGVFRDFTADLKVDEDGLVIDYPTLFSRIQS